MPLSKKSVKLLANLCYNIPGESIYGEITTQSIRQLTRTFGGLQNPVHLLDIGSGSGRMLCEFASEIRACSDSFIHLTGFEVAQIRCELSRQIIPQLITDPNISWEIACTDVGKRLGLPIGVTHCVAFDKTFTPDLMEHIERLQRHCPTLVNVVSNHYYHETHWRCLDKVVCSLRGSKQRMTFYVYSRK